MKIIEVDDELYQYIASKTENIGEQASDILRRLLGFSPVEGEQNGEQAVTSQPKSQASAARANKDEEIEVVIEPEQTAQVTSADHQSTNIESSKEQSIESIEPCETDDENMIAEPEGIYEVTQAEDSELKTTTVKAQEAKHAQISGQDALLEPEQQPESKVEPKIDIKSEDKTSAKTARKVKSRRTPKVKSGPSDEQLTAPVNGLDLPLITESNSVVGRFLYILSALEQKHGEAFKRVLEVQGKGRLYFATSKQELSDAGSNTNPKQIGDSTYWVMTNSNTDRKKQMLGEVSKILGYSKNTIETLLAKL